MIESTSMGVGSKSSVSEYWGRGGAMQGGIEDGVARTVGGWGVERDGAGDWIWWHRGARMKMEGPHLQDVRFLLFWRHEVRVAHVEVLISQVRTHVVIGLAKAVMGVG